MDEHDLMYLVKLADASGAKRSTIPYPGGLEDCSWTFDIRSLKIFTGLLIEAREESENLLRNLDIDPNYYMMHNGQIDVEKLKTAIMNPDLNFRKNHWLRGKDDC